MHANLWLSMLCAWLLAPVGSAAQVFLGPGQFDGNPPPTHELPKVGYQATYDGYLAFSNVARSDVEKLLPKGFRLAPRKDGGSTHPIVLMWGDQQNGAYFSPNETFGSTITYKEAALLIPFVQQTGDSQWFLYSLRLYLDNFWAVEFGNINYGYAKKLAQLTWTGTQSENRRVRSFFPPFDILEATVRTTGPWLTVANAKTAIPTFDGMLEIMGTTVLGKSPEKYGIPFCSYYDWVLLPSTRIARAIVSTKIVGTVRGDMQDWVGRTLSSEPQGAIAIQGMLWQLANPPALCAEMAAPMGPAFQIPGGYTLELPVPATEIPPDAAGGTQADSARRAGGR